MNTKQQNNQILISITISINAQKTCGGDVDTKTPPTHKQQLLPVIMGEVSAFVADNPESSFRAIKSGVGRNQEYVRTAIQRLEEDGYIKREKGIRRAILHSNLHPYTPDTEGPHK